MLKEIEIPEYYVSVHHCKHNRYSFEKFSEQVAPKNDSGVRKCFLCQRQVEFSNPGGIKEGCSKRLIILEDKLNQLKGLPSSKKHKEEINQIKRKIEETHDTIRNCIDVIRQYGLDVN